MTTADPRHERSPELDLLRFIAASAVLFYHYTYRPDIHGVPSATAFGSVQQISRYGYLGVPLFFLISGFVIVWSAQGRAVGQFAVARFKRLYPMFWVGVAMTLAVLLVTERRPELMHPGVIAANLTMLPGRFGEPAIDGVYWTLAIEVKLYVGVAILIALRQMRRLELWLYAWLVGIVLAMALPRVQWLSSLTTAPYSSYFIGGAVCYLVRSSGLTVARALAFLASLIASCWQGVGAIGEFTHAPGLVTPGGVVAIITLCYAAVGAVAMGALHLPRFRVWFALGNLTYPLYLLHNVIGKEVFASLEPLLGVGTRLLVTVGIAYTLAWTCSRWIEPWARSLCGGLLTYANRLTVRAAGL